jgi:hypothetical protein
MMTAEQFIQAWGAEDLVRFPRELVEAIDIPQEAKMFLIEAWLPRWAKFSCEFMFAPLRVAPAQTPPGGIT